MASAQTEPVSSVEATYSPPTKPQITEKRQEQGEDTSEYVR